MLLNTTVHNLLAIVILSYSFFGSSNTHLLAENEPHIALGVTK